MKYIFFLLVAMSAMFLAGCPKVDEDPGNATVNDDVIHESESTLDAGSADSMGGS